MGKNIKYGEFTFSDSKPRPTAKGYAKGGQKVVAKAIKREPEAMVRKEVALLKKAGAPKAIIEHEVRESNSPIAMKKGGMSKMDKKVGKVMGEFKSGDLHSGKNGPVVKNPKQAIAIALSEGRKATKKMAEGGQYASGATEKMRKEGDVLNELSKKYGTMSQKYEKGGSVEKKLEKHANMPASKAHGPGAGNRLKKGGVPVHSRVPKIGQMK